MRIVKYFYEEPMPLEALTPDRDPAARGQRSPTVPLKDLLQAPAYYRGYLAGTDQAADRVGLTTIDPPEAYLPALLAVGGSVDWMHLADGRLDSVTLDQVRATLQAPGPTQVLLAGAASVPEAALQTVGTTPRREAIPALKEVLARCRVAFFPEPAHDGFDWSLYATQPLREPLVDALAQHPVKGVRRFVLPYQRARSEQKFYFESWQLDAAPLPDYIQEV